MRWADILAELDFELQYRPGKQAVRPDALSRREQDVPQDANDERVSHRSRAIFGNVTVQTGRAQLLYRDIQGRPTSTGRYKYESKPSRMRTGRASTATVSWSSIGS